METDRQKREIDHIRLTILRLGDPCSGRVRGTEYTPILGAYTLSYIKGTNPMNSKLQLN